MAMNTENKKNEIERIEEKDTQIVDQENKEITESMGKRIWNKVKKPLVAVTVVAAAFGGGLVVGGKLASGNSDNEDPDNTESIDE